MSTTNRRAAQRKNRAVKQATVLNEIERAGELRNQALADADAHRDRINGLIPPALQLKIPVTEIARVAGVSRQTIYDIQKRNAAENALTEPSPAA